MGREQSSAQEASVRARPGRRFGVIELLAVAEFIKTRSIEARVSRSRLRLTGIEGTGTGGRTSRTEIGQIPSFGRSSPRLTRI